MRRRNLYKYFSEHKWAEAFINGEVLFRSWSYSRGYEDNNAGWRRHPLFGVCDLPKGLLA